MLASVLNMVFENWRNMGERVTQQRIMSRSGRLTDEDMAWKFDHAEALVLGISFDINGVLFTSSKNIESGHIVMKSYGLTLDIYMISANNSVTYASRQPTVINLNSHMGLVTLGEISVNTIHGDDELTLLMLL